MSLDGITNSGNREPTPAFAQQDGSNRILVQVYGNPSYEDDLFTRDYQEYQVEQGQRFSISGGAGLASGAGILLQFYAGKQMQLEMAVGAELATSVYLFEGTSYNAASGGVAVTPINHNRGSALVSVSSWKSAASITVSGTQLFSTILKNAYADVIPRQRKFMVNSGKEHTVRLISGAANNSVGYVLTWTE